MASARRHAVVIGAGLGGLAAAVRLASAGWRVTVLEQHSMAGGKMGLWSVPGGRMDTGPTLVTMPWAFEELFAAASTTMSDEGIALLEVRPFTRCVFDGGQEVVLDNRLPELLGAIRGQERGDAAGFLTFLHSGAAMYALSRAAFFSRSPREGLNPAALPHLKRVPWSSFRRSYHDTAARYCRSGNVRQILDRYPTYVGSSPFKAPGILSVIPATEMLFGAWHVRGGLYRIVEALVRVLGRLRTEVRTATRVTRIDADGGRVTAVQTAQGDRVPCDVAIMNGDAARLNTLLGRPDGGRRGAAEPSLSGLVFLCVVRGRLEGWPHHQVAFSADYRAEFRDLFEKRVFPEDPTVYVCTPSRTDSTMAPPGCELVFVMANAPATDEPWDDEAVRRARRRVMARLSASGLGGWEERIAASEVRTPQWLAETLDMPGGSIYGTASHGLRGTAMRPPNRVRGVRGLYAVGGSTHPGGGTPTVLMSARITCDLVQRHDGA